jgi:hypothetical protein
MSLSVAQKRLLRALMKNRSREELKALFALIRCNGDRALFAAMAPTRKKSRRRADPRLDALKRALKRLMAPSAEKAGMLVEHMAATHRRKLAFEVKGLADAARRLRAADFTDAQIQAGAESLIAHLAKLHGRETVV